MGCARSRRIPFVCHLRGQRCATERGVSPASSNPNLNRPPSRPLLSRSLLQDAMDGCARERGNDSQLVGGTKRLVPASIEARCLSTSRCCRYLYARLRQVLVPGGRPSAAFWLGQFLLPRNLPHLNSMGNACTALSSRHRRNTNNKLPLGDFCCRLYPCLTHYYMQGAIIVRVLYSYNTV